MNYDKNVYKNFNEGKVTWLLRVKWWRCRVDQHFKLVLP